LLLSAGHDLRRARLAGDSPARLREVLDIMRRLGQVTVVLDRYLADIDPFRAAAPHLVQPGSGWPPAALQAREWLGETAQNLRYDGRLHLHPQPPLTAMARYLDSAAVSLSAARDLLHTHLTPDHRGGPYTSEWAPVILSPHFTRAVSAEVASAAVQLAMAAMRAWTQCPPGGYQLEDARSRLASAERSRSAVLASAAGVGGQAAHDLLQQLAVTRLGLADSPGVLVHEAEPIGHGVDLRRKRVPHLFFQQLDAALKLLNRGHVGRIARPAPNRVLPHHVPVAELGTFKRVQDAQITTLRGFVVAVLRDDQRVSQRSD
jgi:hypothetical protein